MTRRELLIAYKEGKLTTAQLQEKLRELKQQPCKTPLSEGQKGLWMLQKVSPEMSSYNVPLCFHVVQKLDIGKFKQACSFLLSQYPILTSVCGEDDDGVSYQMVQPSQPLAWQQEDISALKTNEILPYLRKKAKESFSLERGPLMRVQLLSRSEQEHFVLIVIHHIIFDGSSTLLLIKSLLGAYRNLSEGKGLEITSLSTSFNDFVEWEQAMLSSTEGEEHRAYWRKQLSGILPILEIPTDRPRFSSQGLEGQTYKSVLSPELTEQIKSFVQTHHVNLSIILLGIYKVLLYRYTGQEDIIVGMPTLGRPEERFDSQIGYFVNMVPIRSQVRDDQCFAKFIKELQLTVVDGLDHAVYPFPVIVRELNGPREQTNSPIFQTAFAYQNFLQSTSLQAIDDQRQNSLHIEFIEGIHQEGEFEFALEIFDLDDHFVLNLKYDPDLYDHSTIQRMMGHYDKLAEEIMNDPNLTLGEYSLMSKEEQATILFDWNATQADYPKNHTIHQLFEEQVKRTPDNKAVIFEESNLTYRQLNDKANQLARVLRKKGVKPNSIVGIIAERSLVMIIAIMGILKAGGAYLPIDPEYPEDRIKFMLEDSQAVVLLTQSHQKEKCGFDREVIDLDNEALYTGAVTNMEIINRPNDLAYVIYTSGSTGKPKGAMIEHKNVVRLMFNDKIQFDFSQTDVWTMFHSYCFDFSVWEMYGALLYGGKLIMVSKMTARDTREYLMLLKREKVTVLNQTPTAFYNLIDEEMKCSNRQLNLRYVIFGGEALKPAKLKDWNIKYPKTELINMYGITETTVHVTYKKITQHEISLNISNIGRPIPTLTTYIMSPNMKLQPIGVIGELCVGGDGLGRGYIKQPELTAKKFVQNPYRPEEIIYKSGDLARYLPNGELEYLGRIDHQVKIRGFRIELGEIESRLLKHETILETIVIAKEDHSGNKYLCAYIVGDKELNVTELRNYLSKELPDYMIPSYFIPLEKIPLTSNNKVDRKMLPDPDSSITTGAEYEAPRNDIEKILAQIWQEVLEVKNIGINDNFFALGGDSIKAIQVVARLQRFKLKLDVKSLLTNPEIKDLSKYVVQDINEIEQGAVTGQVELTPIQEWFFERNLTNMHHYNQAVMLYNKHGLNEAALREVFQTIAEHHDILRSIYSIDKGEPVQTIRGIDKELFTLKVYDYTNDDNSAEKITKAANKIQSSIVLNNGPLLKLGLFKTSEGDHLLIVIHHLAVDGISWRILMEDIQMAYAQAINNAVVKLPEKTDSYKVWAQKLKDYANNKQLMNEVSYWRNIENTPISPLPKDHEITNDKVGNSELLTSIFAEEETEKLLRQVNQAYNTEINDILLTSLGLAIKDWSGIDKVLINLEGHGREQDLLNINIARTVGWFTSIYPVILDLSRTDDLSQQIISIKENFRQIPNKGIGYGILRYLTPQEAKGSIVLNRKPEIIFNYLGQFDQSINKDEFQSSRLSSGNTVSQQAERSYTIEINGVIVDGKLSITFDYNKNEYDKTTIQKLANSFNKHLKSIIEHCITKEEAQITPSDTSVRKFDLKEFNNILNEFEENLL